MIFVVTNRNLIPNGDLLSKVEQVVAAEAEAIILREKDLPYDQLITLARKVKSITNGHKTKLIISQSVEIAKEVEAWGVNLSFETFIRSKPYFEGVIGVSVHSVKEAIKAEELGAGYLLAGHIYSTNCKKGLEPRGTHFIKEIRANTSIPIIGIGGISETNCIEVLSNGAQGIALMSSVMESDDCSEMIIRLKETLQIKTIKD